MKNKKRVYFWIVLSVLIILAIFTKYFFQDTRVLELNGNNEMVVELNKPFEDPGTNIEDVEIKGNVDVSKEGDYTLTYTYHKQNVSRIVFVRDSSRIVMNLNGSEDTYILKDDPYIESFCHVIDKKTGQQISDITINGNVDTSTPGEYEVTYSVEYDHMKFSKARIVHVEENFQKNTKGVPVLMYHYVYTKDDVPQKLNSNYILDTDLEQQLQYFIKNHYYFPSYQELHAYIQGQISLPEKSVVVTFDDAQSKFLKYGIPLLEKYKVPATSFVIGTKNGYEKIKKYASEYITFQSHSYDMHKPGGNIGHGGVISALNKNQIIDDLKKAQNLVQNTEAFAYPYGDYTDIAKLAIKESNILCAFTTEYGRVKKGMDYTCLPRIRVLGGYSLNTFIQSVN